MKSHLEISKDGSNVMSCKHMVVERWEGNSTSEKEVWCLEMRNLETRSMLLNSGT